MNYSIEDFLEGKDKNEKTLIDVLRDAKFLYNPERNKIIILSNNIIAYQISKNFMGIRDVIETAIKNKLGNCEIEIGPITTLIQQNESDLLLNLVPYQSVLNKEYTLDNFEISTCNEPALKIALLISNYQERLRAHRQLFVHGGYGFGKTMLLQAVAWHFLSNGMKVAYFTSESFTSFVVETLLRDPYKRTEKLKPIREANALVVDDVHFLEGKPRVQDELKELIDTFFTYDKILIFSSLYPQAKLKGVLKGELYSRFEDGFTIGLKPPDEMLKRKLLEKTLAEKGYEMSEEDKKLLISIEVESVRRYVDIMTIIKSAEVMQLLDGKRINMDKLIEELQNKDIKIPTLTENKISKYIREKYEGLYTLDMLKGNILGINRRKYISVRTDIIYQLAKSGVYSQAEIARVFNISKGAVSLILKKRNRSN